MNFKLKHLFKVWLIFSLALVCSVSTSQAKEEKELELNTKENIETHIRNKLEETLLMIIKPSRFFINVEVKTRKNRVVKEKAVYLGKLGAQESTKAKSKVIWEPLTKRVTSIRVDFYVHPLVEPSKVEIALRLIKSTTPFATKRNLKINKHEMGLYPKNVLLSEYVDGAVYWVKTNQEIIMKAFNWVVSIVFILAFIYGTLRFSIKKFKVFKEAVHNRINEIKYLGLEPPAVKLEKSLDENLVSQIKLFESRLNTVEKKALEIRKWIYLEKFGVNETLRFLPKLLGESTFSKVYACLSTDMQRKWQEIINTYDDSHHKEIVLNFLRDRNLEGMQEKDNSKMSAILDEMTVSLNVEELSIFLTIEPKYGPFLLTSLPEEIVLEVMEKLNAKVRFKIAEEGVNYKDNDVSFHRTEIREVIEKVKVRQELHKIESLKYDFLLDNLAYSEEELFFEQVKRTKTDRLKSIFRLSLPQDFIEKMPTRVLSIILSKVDLTRRVKFIMSFNEEKKKTIMDHFDNHEPKVAMILRQEISRFEGDPNLMAQLKFKAKVIKQEFNEVVKKEFRQNDVLFSIIEKDLVKWINLKKKDQEGGKKAA